MKKTLLFAAALTMLLASCDKNNDGKKELDAEFALETVGALTYGEPVALTGTITSNTTIDKVVFTGQRKQKTAHSQLSEKLRKEASTALLHL